MRRRPKDNLLLSLLGILPGAPALEPVPRGLRHFPLRAGLAFSCVWCWGVGGGHPLAGFAFLFVPEEVGCDSADAGTVCQ